MQIKYNQLMDELESKTKDLSSLKGFTSNEDYNSMQLSVENLTNETDELAVKLDCAKEHALKLSTQLQNAKLNPANSKDVVDLEQKISLAESKLQSSKEKANELKDVLSKKNKFKEFVSDEIDKAKDKASTLKDKIKNLFSRNKGANAFSNQLDGISKKISHFGKRISRLVLGAFVFNVLRTGLSKLSQGLRSALSSNEQFSSSLSQIKGNLLTAFTPIYNFILPAINTLMSALTSITGQIATFVSGIFGQTAKQAQGNAKALYNQAKAYDSVGKSAKEAEGNTASFDNLEVIGGSDNGGGGNSGTNKPDFTTEVQQSGKLFDLLNQIKALVSSGDWGGLADLLSEKTVNILNNIANGIRNIPWTDIGKVISDFITNIDFSGIFVGLVSIFGEALLGFQDLILAIDWGLFFKNFGDGIRDAFLKINDYILQIRWSEIGQKLADSFNNVDWGGIGSAILTGIWNVLAGLVDLFLAIDWSQVGTTISDAVHEWINTVIDLFLQTDWAQLGVDIADAIFDFIEGVDWLKLGADIIKGLAIGLASAIGLIIGFFAELLDRILNFFGIHSPSTVFADIGIYFMKGMLNGINSLKNSILQVFKDIWSGIQKIFGNVTSWFKNKFTDAWTAVKNVFSTGGRIFDGIKEGILSGFTSVVNGIISGINKVVSVPFNGINNTLSKIRNVDILGNKPFKGLVNTISVPKIPMLAKGAVIPPNAKFLAMLGDQTKGKNLEGPEDLFRKIVREESGNKDVIFNGTFIVQCDNLELGRASLKGLRLMEQKNGKKYLVN